MKFWKHVSHLVIIFSLLFTASFIFSELLNLGLVWNQILAILTVGFAISLISLWIFYRGIQKEGQNRIHATMAALGTKLLLYLVLILVFHFISEIKGVRFVVTFFIVYLSFTYYLLKVFIQKMTIKKNGQ